jgi:hypothetical protein
MEGEHFVLGQTESEGGIWTRQSMAGGQPGEPIARFPLTTEGWAAAQAQFATWEPNAQLLTTPPAGPPPRAKRNVRRPLLIGAVAVVIVAAVFGVAYLFAGRSHKPVNVATTPGPGTAEGASRANAGPHPVGKGYLAVGSDFVAFVQWTDANGTLTGTAQEVSASGTTPNETTTKNTLSLMGTLQGSTLTISFEHQPQSFGQLSDGAFTINVPQPDGTLAPVTFRAASASAFNAAVQALTQQVAAADQQAAAIQAQQQQQAAAAAALQKAESQVDSDASAVANDLGAVSKDESGLAGTVGSTQGALQKEAAELATVHTEDQQVIAEAQQYPDGNNGQVCYDADQKVAYDAEQGVAYDAQQDVEYEAVQDVEPALSALRGDVSQLSSDFFAFRADVAKVPGYQTANPPDPTAVSGAAAAANKAIAVALATTNGYIDQANADVTTAFGYAAQAIQAGPNCGQPPTAPPPQGHIA